MLGYKLININYFDRQSSLMSQINPTQEITLKKIQNYIFNFNEMIGQGNFSKVYRAHNEVTKQVVAIKIVQLNSLKSKKLEELLFSQIQILKRLNHPNVLRCHEVFTSNRNCYIITELCNEGDLESKVRNKKSLKEYEAERYIKDIFKGLVYLAENHIVHRDLKVANIFIHNGQAKLADFGFAKVTKTKFKDINIGSPIYMSPEGLIQNVYGPKTDVWAFGMLIYELLHGETPFSHCKSENELKYNMSIPIGWSQLKPELSNQIKEVVIKCLEIDQNKRISTMQLKKLPYFNRSLSLSPNRFLTKGQTFNTSYQTNLSPSPFHSNNSIQKITFKGDHPSERIKYRIKTQNEITQPKRTERQFSELGVRPSLKEPPPSVRQERSANILLRPIEEGGRRQSHSKYNLSGKLPNSYSKLITSEKQNSSFRGDIILSSIINFKQCVNILHYCRMLFKHLTLMKEISFGDQNQTSIFKKWLSAILKTLMREITQKKVRCEGDNSEARQRKLQEVTSQYIKKYSKDLNLDLSKLKVEESLILNYDKIYSYFTSVYQMIDQMIQKDSSNRQLLQLGHSMIMICSHTKIMKMCYDERNYKRIEREKQIEQFLATNKSHLDLPSYQLLKKRCSINTLEFN